MTRELTDSTRAHVMRDLQPYMCIFRECHESMSTYGSRFRFETHIIYHETYGSNFKYREPFFDGRCSICGEALKDKLEKSIRHVARHLEEIAFAVATKPYEDWEFYSETSASSKEKPPEIAPSRSERFFKCHLCTKEKKFSRNYLLSSHIRVVHPDLISKEQIEQIEQSLSE